MIFDVREAEHVNEELEHSPTDSADVWSWGVEFEFLDFHVIGIVVGDEFHRRSSQCLVEVGGEVTNFSFVKQRFVRYSWITETLLEHEEQILGILNLLWSSVFSEGVDETLCHRVWCVVWMIALRYNDVVDCFEGCLGVGNVLLLLGCS